MKKYVILEIIPSSLFPQKGEVLQLSALKVDDFKIVDRFDKRIVESKIPFPALEELVSYDKKSFSYEKETSKIMQLFKNWTEDLPLLIIDNQFTRNYLDHYEIGNPRKPVFESLNMKYNDFVVEEMIEKYQLQPSNYVVDLIFEALIYEDNNKKTLGKMWKGKE